MNPLATSGAHSLLFYLFLAIFYIQFLGSAVKNILCFSPKRAIEFDSGSLLPTCGCSTSFVIHTIEKAQSEIHDVSLCNIIVVIRAMCFCASILNIHTYTCIAFSNYRRRKAACVRVLILP